MKKAIVFILLIFTLWACKKTTTPSSNINYKKEMRSFVESINNYAKEFNSNFAIVPQNGHNLLTANGDITDSMATDYINAIDAVGREDLFYGYNNDNEATPESARDEMIAFAALARDNGKAVLTTDYCSDHDKMDLSYQKNSENGFISFAANHRMLDNIPDYPAHPFNENENDINSVSDAKNFLYLLDTENFGTKEDFINAVNATNYDLLIMDLFFNDDDVFTNQEIESLKHKANGGKRFILCYMSIGEAENYRYYWQSSWSHNPPSWMAEENPNWEGNFKVKYWDKDWQGIIFGNDNSYLKKILDANFDGVYLDIIDAFEYFE